jgi:4-hydroxybenzoate polyprenyltransferase
MRLSHPALRDMNEATHEASRLLDRLQAEHRIPAAPETAPAAAASISSLVSVDKPSKRGLHAVARVAEFNSAIEDRAATLGDYLSALRPQHWLKNLLVFVAILAAHRFVEPVLLARTFVEFVASCCFASSGYLVNDLCDLQADRRHPQKRLRPFASGRLPLAYALTAASALAVLGCVLAGLLSAFSLEVVLLYFALTLGYSFTLKRVVLLDVLVLAGLYTLRIVAGAAAISSWPSVWLLAFSMFLFISLAFIKRYSELMVMRATAGNQATARGYELSDAELLASKGTASGYAAVLVLAIYIASSTVNTPYSRHQLIWLACPLLLYWVGYLWLIAHRGRMHHDPLVFALRDGTSRVLILLMLVTVLLSAI